MVDDITDCYYNPETYEIFLSNIGEVENLSEDEIDKFYETIDKVIQWICKKFDMGTENNLIRDFQEETNTYLDAEKQIKHEEMKKGWDLER